MKYVFSEERFFYMCKKVCQKHNLLNKEDMAIPQKSSKATENQDGLYDGVEWL